MPDQPARSDRIRGLGQQEARERLAREGYNELPQPDRRSPLRIVLEVVREPMMALLLGGGTIYLVLGDLQEALILLAFATLSVSITVVQETRTERVLEALRDLSSPRALVIRDGERQRIAGREVVREDIVVLSEGDRVPADAVVIECHDLLADESLLTGESVPVRKRAGGDGEDCAGRRPGGDDLPCVFSGSLVVRGNGLARVFATGAASEIGRIGRSLREVQTEPPRLLSQTRRLVRVFALAGGAVSILAVLLYGTLRGGWLDAMLAGIALGMSMLPEEFPVVLTVFMAVGAWRISRARVLTRRAAAIEALGSATVLCTDKTGTLTENRMSVAELRPAGGGVIRPGAAGSELPAAARELVRFGRLASAPDAVDPMDQAFLRLADTDRGGAEALTLLHGYGLRPGLLATTQVWRPAGIAGPLVVAAKGAPEAVAALCHLDDTAAAELKRGVDEMAAAGLRVLGVARAEYADDYLPDSQHDFEFRFLGLVGLADPLRPGVREAVGECRSAGIRVVMITGDYPATARAIAAEAGIDADEVLSGEELDRLDDAALAARVRDTTVFARIMPEQKLRIVEALKRSGAVVAMTGDGVNDAPSLKAAHIGVAMGGRGTDVAREASAIVLLDDDFGSIVRSVRLGRRIYDNLRKALGFIFAVHVPIAGLALLPLATDLPILLWPAHIAFLEMVIDPVCTLVFEAETEEEVVMRRPPRDPGEPLFSVPLVVWGLVQGGCAFALVAIVYLTAGGNGMPETELRALAFFTLVWSIIALIFVNRSFGTSLLAAIRRPNPALALVLGAVTILLGVTLAWPPARALFHFGALHADDLAVALGGGLVVLVVLELLKPALAGRH